MPANGIDNMPVVESLLAAGGLCSAPEARYAVELVGTTERPVRAALPSFRADRGHLSFTPAPHLADILENTTSAAATSVTAAEDASNKSKTYQTLVCPDAVTVQVEATALRIRTGNMAEQFHAEWTSAWVRAGMVADSRLSERRLVEQLRAASTAVHVPANELGAFSTLTNALELLSTQQKYRHRHTGAVTAILPAWVTGVLATDLRRRGAGDNVLAADAGAMLDRAAATFGVSIAYRLDDSRSNNSNGAGAPLVGSTVAGTAADWPGRVRRCSCSRSERSCTWTWYMIDWSFYRDSVLAASNQTEMFYESWQNVAKVGVESIDATVELCAVRPLTWSRRAEPSARSKIGAWWAATPTWRYCTSAGARASARASTVPGSFRTRATPRFATSAHVRTGGRLRHSLHQEFRLLVDSRLRRVRARPLPDIYRSGTSPTRPGRMRPASSGRSCGCRCRR